MSEEKAIGTETPNTSPSGEENPEAVRRREPPSPLDPFAKAYNGYFRAVYGMQRALQCKVLNAHQTYSKEAQEAMQSRSCEAFDQAGERLRTELGEASPARLVDGVHRAFEAYQQEVRAAFAAEEAQSMDPVSLMLIAQSMGVIAYHRMAYGGL
jgi:hypothetical protein